MRSGLSGLALILIASATAPAQDTSFSELRLRAAVFRNPVIGHIGDDWRARTGIQAEIGSNIGVGDLSLGVGHIGYDALTGKPPFTGTLFSLGFTAPVLHAGRARIDLGARLTDMRMDFDDPALVAGLRTEEEVIVNAIVRGRVGLGRQFTAYADVSYGVLMLSTKTPMLFVGAGVERAVATPSWLREILR